MLVRGVIALLVGLGLIGSFAVAFVDGQRVLGGIVLIVVGLACAIWLYRIAGWRPTLVTGFAYALGFGLSHPLGDLVGPWPSVVVVALVAAVVAFVASSGRIRP